MNSQFREATAPLGFCGLVRSLSSKAGQTVQADELVDSAFVDVHPSISRRSMADTNRRRIARVRPWAGLFTLAASALAATAPSITGLYTTQSSVLAAQTVTAQSVTYPMISATDTVSLRPSTPNGASYYLGTAAGGGSDSNSGLYPSEPWLTPNHALNCGDTITAAPSAGYSAANFASGRWGTVSCTTGDSVAWLKCATFDGCRIGTITQGNGMTITSSYWGVRGWEVDGTQASSYCFLAQPPTTAAGIHHVIFADDVAVGCGLAGVESGNNGLAGVDYFAIVGDIAYNDAGGSRSCGSGLVVYSPVASDTLPGTHIYVGGNFSWGNVNGSPCGGGAPTDGNGLIFDTFDGRQTSGLSPYVQQAVADNNILIDNGGRGLEVLNNDVGAQSATVVVRHNTVWGNNYDTNQTEACACIVGEILIVNANNTAAFSNIAVTNAATGPNSFAVYDFWATTPSGTDQVYQNIGYSATGTYAAKYDPFGLFLYSSSNLFGANPAFASAVAPGAPSCGGASSVPNCMAPVIANLTPTMSAADAYGYQLPAIVPVYDPLFPQWLCNVNLPAGLVTMGCLSGS